MLAEIKQEIKNLKESINFKEWKQKHPHAYLASCFILDADNKWQIAFYSPETDKISTFVQGKLDQDDAEIFKKEADVVEELELETIKIDIDKALEISEQLRKEKYSFINPTQKMIILQHFEKALWNITYISSKILNVKIDAISGKVVYEELISTVDLAKR